MPAQFLGDDDYRRFKSYVHPRLARRPGETTSQTLDSIVASLLATGQRQAGIGLHQAARLFRVHRGDGLSWTAESLAQIVTARLPHCSILAFTRVRAERDLPEIFRHIGLRQSLRACARAGVYDSRFGRKVLIDSLVVLAAIAVVFVVDLVTPAQGRTAHSVVLLTALSGVLAAILANHVRFGRDPQVLSDLADALNRGCAQPGQVRSPVIERAIEQMAFAFHHLNRPACVIIDDFASVDPFTQAVLHHAMRADRSAGIGALFWIVIEQIEAGELARELAADPSTKSKYVGGELDEYKLEPLTLEERGAVLRHNRLPLERAQDEVFVKALVRGANAAEIDQITTILETLSQTESQVTDLRASTLFRVIAVNSYPPGFELSTNEYLRIFLERQAEGHRRLFPILLRTYLDLPGLPKDRATELLKTLQQRLNRVIIEPASATDRLRVRAIGREALARWHVTQLPEEAIHLFWLLWWQRSRVNDHSPSFLQKLAHHAGPARLDARLLTSNDGPALALEVIHALMQVSDACLHATLVSDALAVAQSLLQNARVVLSTKPLATETISDKTWAGIARVCWQVYLATGADEFLINLLSVLVDARFSVPPAEAKAAEDKAPVDIVAPYLRVMNASANELDVMGNALQRLIMRDDQLGTRLRAHMRCRTLEVVGRCERFAYPALVEKAGLPSSQAIEAALDKQELVRICDAIYNDAERRFTIIDHAVLRDALLHAVHVEDVRTAREIIPAFVFAPQARRDGSVRADRALTVLERAFRLHTVAICLDALLRLAIAAMPTKHPRYQFQPRPTEFSFRNDIVPGALAGDIRDALAAAAAEFGGKAEPVGESEAIPPAVLVRVSELYLQAAIAWDVLGLVHLTNRTHMDRARFLFEFTSADPAKPATFDRIIQSLGPALTAAGLQSVMSHLEVAEFFDSVRQLRSLYVTEAVTRLLKLDSASDLALVFCMFLNPLPIASAVDTVAAADHVVKLLENFEFLDHFVERFGAEQDATPGLVNKLMSVAANLGGADLKTRAFAMVHRLIAHPRITPAVRHELEVLRDWYDMRRQAAPTTPDGVSKVLTAWEERRGHWMYPAVLGHLLDGAPTPDVIEACFSVLEGDGVFRGSPAVHLTHRLAAVAADGADERLRARAVGVLRRAAAKAGHWEIELARTTFTLMMRLDPENGEEHAAQHIHWTGVMLERNRAEAFAHMLHQGFFFGVFRSYWEGLEIYGLAHAPVNADWCAGVRSLLRSNNRPAAIERCLARMQSEAPPLIVRPQNQPCVADDYVLTGQLLFTPDLPLTNEITIARDTLNQIAGRDLRTFLEIVLMAETVPEVLRNFIREHRQYILEELAAARSAA